MTTTKPRHWLIGSITALLALAGIFIIALGILGAGSTPTPVPAPTIKTPFTSHDQDTYTGPTAVKEAMATEKPLGPMELAVPSVGLRISLVNAGITSHDAIDLPLSNLAAHYTPAAPIGSSAGSTVIAGHLNYPNGVIAPMGLLSGIQKGAPIFITDANGKILRYKADDARLYAKHALPAELFQTTGTPKLVLITCGGPIGTLDGVLNYLDNTTITATPWP